MKLRKLYKLNSMVTASVFLCAIFVPLFVGIFSSDQLVSVSEKRSLVQMPGKPRTLEELRSYPESFDKFYSDQFGLREWFTGTYNLAKFLLGDSPSNDVTIGKNGWLFLGSVKNNKNRGVIDDVRNVNLYTQQELSEFGRYIAGLNAWLDERNIKYVFVIAPNKHSIYFDQMPNYIQKVNEKSATDQLFEYLKSHTKVSVVDLRRTLIEEKQQGQLYFKSDSHWNHKGANIAQNEIMKEVEKFFPTKIEPELFVLRETMSGGGDLERLMGIDVFTELNPKPVFDKNCTPIKNPPDAMRKETFKVTCNGQELRAIIFRDSFFNALEPYFSRKFANTTYISEISSYSSLSKYLELEHPDVVIEEWVERNLPYLPKNNDHFMDALVESSFEGSQKVIFKIGDSNFTHNKWLEPINLENEALEFEVTGTDPIITLPTMPFEPHRDYVLYINMESSVDTASQVFFSDADQHGQPFSEMNSLRAGVTKGRNELFFHLYYPKLGARLRLDPVSKLGEISINSLEIREVELPQ